MRRHFATAVCLAATTTGGCAVSTADRIRGAFYGALVSDALALGAHYEYDAKVIKAAYGGKTIEEYMAPGERMGGTTHGVGWGRRKYHPGQGKGDQTDYGEYNLLMLEYLASLADSGADFTTQPPLDKLLDKWEERLTKQKWGAWVCTQTKQTLQQVRGMTKQQRAALRVSDLGGMSNAMAIRNAAAFAAYSDEETLVGVSRLFMFTHRNEQATVGGEFFTRVVHRIIHKGMTPREAIDDVVANSPLRSNAFVKEQVRKGIAKFDEVRDASRPLGREEFVDDLAMTSMARLWNVGKTEPIKVGKASPTEGTMPSSIYMILKYESSLVEAAKANAMVGGDSASRAIAIGMVLGSYHGARTFEDHATLGKSHLNAWFHAESLLGKLPLLNKAEAADSSNESKQEL